MKNRRVVYTSYTRNNEHIGFHVKHISKASKVLTRLMCKYIERTRMGLFMPPDAVAAATERR